MKAALKRLPQRGQALVEAGIVVVLFITIALGLLTFGHAFMVANMITHATRDGARLAATWPNRTACGALSNTSDITTQVQNEIRTVTPQTFQVAYSQNRCPTPPCSAPCANPTTPTVTVTVTGCVPYVFPLLPRQLGVACPGGGVGFSVSRKATFFDEGAPPT